MSVIVAITSGTALSCGGKSHLETLASSQGEESWVTDQEWRLVSPQRCVTGPFEVAVPARDFEYGRRFVVEVYGPRAFRIDYRYDYGGTSYQTGSASSTKGEGDHSRCRHNRGDAVVAGIAETGTGTTSETGDGGRGPVGGGAVGGGAVGGGAVGQTHHKSMRPSLVEFQGELPATRQHGSASAWLPLGHPTKNRIGRVYYSYFVEDVVKVGFRFRFWFLAPSDMEGVVIRLRDERLLPKRNVAGYRARFLRRVAAVKQIEARKNRKRATTNSNEAYCAANPDHLRCIPSGVIPPLPRKEVRPKPPPGNIDWLPGYWRYVRATKGFVWIGGTYVVRSSPYAKRQPLPPQRAVTANPTPQPISDSIPPPPPPRVEAVSPPPAVAGAVWVAGYWKLHASKWTWVAGRWQLPRQRRGRFRAPTIDLRGGVRVYIPGGWVLGR